MILALDHVDAAVADELRDRLAGAELREVAGAEEELAVDHGRGRPVAVTNGLQGTCIITCSYEARAYGICTGMRLKKARRLCPELIQCPADPGRYAAASTAIMAALQDVTPDIEVFSVD